MLNMEKNANSISSHATLSDRIEASFGTREELTRISLLTALRTAYAPRYAFDLLDNTTAEHSSR